MTELFHSSPCDSVRDLLPEFTCRTLAATDAHTVQVHLTICEACRAEAAVLQMMHQPQVHPARVSAARIDAIVAALPAPPVAEVHPAIPPTIARRTVWRVRMSSVRVAATLAVVLTGALSWGMWQLRDTASGVPLSDTPPVAIADAGRTSGTDVWSDEQGATSIAPAVLPMQALGEFTDTELEQLLAHINAWDGAPSASTGSTLNSGGDGASAQPNTTDISDTIDFSRSNAI